MAVAVWNQVNSGCVITADIASSGVMTGKNVTVPGQCDGSMSITILALPHLTLSLETTVGGLFLVRIGDSHISNII